MNKKLLEEIIKHLEKQIIKQQIEHTEITKLKKYFPLDWNKKIVEINYSDSTTFETVDNNCDIDNECPASKIW